METKHSARDDPKCSQCTSDELRKIITSDVFHHLAAAARQRAIRQRNRDADDQVAQGAKSQTKRPAVIRRKHSANRRSFRPQRIKGQPLAVFRQRFLQSLNGAARFDRYGKVRPGVFDDFIQPCR